MMRLTRDEFERIGAEPPLELFLQGIRAKATRDQYTTGLRNVLCVTLDEILEGSFEQRVEQFVARGKENPEWIRDLVLNISKKLRQRTELPPDHPDYYNPSSFNNYFKPIKKLLDMNDVILSWKRIYATFPEKDNVVQTRGWTKKEIQRMLTFAKGPMDRTLLLVAASSGMRAGGFDLKWGDVMPIYKKDDHLSFAQDEGHVLACAMISVYSGTSACYPAFITPEAYGAMEDYRGKWAGDVGREPRPEDPLFKVGGPLPRQVNTKAIYKRFDGIVRAAGFRAPKYKVQRRFEVPTMNGFRRFWNKTCKESLSRDSPLASLIKKEYMMGHTGLVALDRNYFQTHTMELAEEYMNAVPGLTIDDAVRLRESNRLKAKQVQNLEKQGKEIEGMRKMIAMLTKKIEAMS